MRSVERIERASGIRFKVRYRHGGKQTAEYFLRERDARSFAALLDAGGPPEALSWLEQRQSSRSGYTFAEWFEHYVDHLTGVEPRTRDDYRSQRRRYLTSLDHLPLASITRAHVAEIINGMDARGLSSKTIKNARDLLSSCLSQAVEEGHLTRNPARKHRLPQGGADDGEDEDAQFLTHEEFARLLEQIPEHYRPLVTFLVGTGLRWSEATALLGRHIDTTGQTVRVRRAWKRVPGVGFEVGSPKSKKSRRTVNAAPQAIEAVRPLLRGPNDYVFTTVTGKPVAYSNFHARVWRPAVLRAGLDVGIHSLRHTHASWLISLGATLEQVQDQLGHESILTTRKVYAQLQPTLGAQLGQLAAAAMVQVEQARPVLEG